MPLSPRKITPVATYALRNTHFGPAQSIQMDQQQNKYACDCSAPIWVDSKGFLVTEQGI